MIKYSALILGLLLTLLSCKEEPTGPLKVLGNTKMVDGKEVQHTVGIVNHYSTDSTLITNKELEKYIYVADFFFTSCPSICPKVTKEMMKIYGAVIDDPMVRMVSFTIDPKRDTPAKMKLYAENLGVDTKKWLFLNGDMDATHELANTYFVPAMVDKNAPGGFDHSGKIILVDKEGRVRSFSEGTDPATTPQLIKDIEKLKEEYKK